MPQIRKEVKKHCRLCLQIRGREYLCYIHPILLKKCEQHSSLAPFCDNATMSLDHVQRGEKVLHLVQQKQITGGQDRV